MQSLAFHKMEGAGNDYVYLDHRRHRPLIPDESLVQLLSDRRYGIGGDGLIELLPAADADCRMEMWNSDGSRSFMCGNALRCVAYLLHRDSGGSSFSIQTGSGLYRAWIEEFTPSGARVKVNMGVPRFEAAEIPVQGDPERLRLSVDGLTLEGRAVGMGNPHCVIFFEERSRVDALDLERIGRYIQESPLFPESVNVEFVALESDGALYQRTYERGSGETLACGSGACAAYVAAVLSGRVGAQGIVRLRGGELFLEYRASPGASVFMTGPAHLLFSGNFYVAPANLDR
ncbi:MAG: diaminopimelate epimerase [Spirochaetales bacterium]|nr:diaminopimelate epimerase [Spirochaetales bacterium]